MKRIIGFLIIVFFFTRNTFAQKISQSNVPAVVLNSFQLKFTNAEDVIWKLEEGTYHIKFEINDKFNELYLDYKGNVLKYHQDLWGSEVPESVLKTLRSRVKYFDLNDADFFEEGDEIYYEINFEIEDKDHDFWISEKGKLLKYRKELKDSEIPKSIVDFINNKYGTIEIDYSKYVEEKGKIIYIIRGQIDDNEHVFTVDNKGYVLKHKEDLREDEIPNPISQSLKKFYKDYDIRDVDMIEKGGKSIYILRIKKSRKNIYVTFSPEGKLLEEK
ncbi:MAG: PepSY-like domain-containing protein [Flammeovirgaceae bacterium]|nr:PepSY-like domain-containing protein [Flammeovirgaceae bacterium]